MRYQVVSETFDAEPFANTETTEIVEGIFTVEEAALDQAVLLRDQRRGQTLQGRIWVEEVARATPQVHQFFCVGPVRTGTPCPEDGVLVHRDQTPQTYREAWVYVADVTPEFCEAAAEARQDLPNGFGLGLIAHAYWDRFGTNCPQLERVPVPDRPGRFEWRFKSA